MLLCAYLLLKSSNLPRGNRERSIIAVRSRLPIKRSHERKNDGRAHAHTAERCENGNVCTSERSCDGTEHKLFIDYYITVHGCGQFRTGSLAHLRFKHILSCRFCNMCLRLKTRVYCMYNAHVHLYVAAHPGPCGNILRELMSWQKHTVTFQG